MSVLSLSAMSTVERASPRRLGCVEGNSVTITSEGTLYAMRDESRDGALLCPNRWREEEGKVGAVVGRYALLRIERLVGRVFPFVACGKLSRVAVVITNRE
jgi:hypothetical protein